MNRESFLKIYGVDPNEWCRKAGIELWDAKCPECENPLKLNVPIVRGTERGVMSEVCVCGTDNRPYAFVIDWSKHV